jgi:exodeoxyribonuclease VII large subunit
VLARDELVAELDRSGRLRAQAGLVVPAVPRRIGLVSSPGAAGRADVLEVLARSPLPLELVEATAAMSGPGAPDEVARAIELLGDAGVDVILIARGGGAKSDLAAWESQPVALAITACAVPVWTALGHATDHTLADSLAQTCHPTPTAAATVLVGRAEAALRAEQHEAERRRHQDQLAASRRASAAMALAVVLLLVGVLALLAHVL